MDIVYICRQGKNEELRYSIRSVVKNLPGSRIWVVGYKPDWYVGDFISVPDTSSKFKNIHNLIKTIAYDDRISEDFVFMNDDFFFLEPMSTVPVLHGGSLKDKIDRYRNLNPNSPYIHLLNRTYQVLITHGILNPIDYDIHVPMPMNRTKLKETILINHLPRSTYGNLASIGGSEITDVKAYSRRSAMAKGSYNYQENSLPFVSCEDDSFEALLNNLLIDRFNEPSKYEVPLAGIEPATKRLEGSYSIH